MAQVEKPIKTPAALPAKKDSIPLKQSLAETDTTQKDSVKTKPPKSDIETTIVYSADDSIISQMDKKIVKLYGNAKVTYGQIKLDAEEITIDYEKSTIIANGVRDSTGELIGAPVFHDGNDMYETKGMIYNIKTKKARITEVVTKQGEGFMHGETVFKNQDNNIFTLNNAYTTCDLADPHFRIISKKAKAIPGDKIVSGPFYMEFNHVPTPLGFAFGIFPSQRKASSGILMPMYGEEQTRGFFLRRGGYYFNISDFINLSLTGDIYSKGSSALYLNSTYISRYRYNGSVAISFTNNNYSTQIEKPSSQKDFSITWSHTPKSKGTSRFSASVNAASSTNSTNNYLGVGQTNMTSIQNSNLQRKASSNISYSKSFPGTPFALAINLQHNQDFSTRRVDLSLPNISFNVNNVYPFKKSKSMILQNLQFKYTMNAVNQITNDLGNIARADGTVVDSVGRFDMQHLSTYFSRGNKGIKHVIPISTSFKVLKFFTLTASTTFNSLWYFDKVVWGVTPNPRQNPLSLGKQVVKTDTFHLFNTESYYNFSMSMTTRIYGTYLAKKNSTSSIKGIRHLITPSIGFSYQPDFSAVKHGYYQRVGYTDGNGKPVSQLQSIHSGFVYGSAPTGRSEALSFGIGNTLEMKVKTAKDTVARKVSLLNNLSLSSSYNFLADSMKLSNISMSANTNVLNNKININMSGTLDPYEYISVRTGTGVNDVPIRSIVRVNHYAWSQGKIGKITSATLAFSTNLNPQGQKGDNDKRDKIAKSNASQADKDYLLKHPDMYVDFSIPWNLRLSYNLSYSNNGTTSTITQSTQFSGDVSLSEKWKVTYSSGYDFKNNQFTQTNLGLSRDLHCWQMSLNWVPFGKFQSYTFNIGIKSSLLKDLKLNRTRSFADNQQGY